MRVLLLTTDSYGGHGGIAYYNRCLAEALAEMPVITQVVVVPRVQRFAAPRVPAKIRFLGHAAGNKARYLKAVAGLAFEKVDMVICGHVNLLPLAASFAALKRAPLVLQVHGIEVWQPAKAYARLWLMAVDVVWSVSAVTRNRMNAWARLPLSQYQIIPNTIRLERYGIAPQRSDLVAQYGLAGRKVIMTLARLAGYERYKGIDEILEALPALLKQDERLTYMVLGDGDDQSRLEAKAKALGISTNVIFAGFIKEEDKADYLRLADVFALPGRGEGFGIVYLEAMACGVPVVGSFLDGSREALRDGQLGELVDPSNPSSVRDGIIRALEKRTEIPSGLNYFAWPAFLDRVANAALSVLALHRSSNAHQH
jgi:phosphatidyl-myo-inositol dimannoside synthase